MATREPRVVRASPSVACARRNAAEVPIGWSKRAALRALAAGQKQRGVHAIELRPGGVACYILQKRWVEDGTQKVGWPWVETARSNTKTRQRGNKFAATPAGPTSASAEPVGVADGMTVESTGSYKLARSQQRLASYGKAMVFLQRLVLKRWAEGVRLEVQQRAQQERAETVAAATAAAEAAERNRLAAVAADERRRLVRDLAAARRELLECKDNLHLKERELAALSSRTEHRHGDERMTERAPKRPHEPPNYAAGRQPQPEVASESLTGEGKGKGFGRGKGFGNGSGDSHGQSRGDYGYKGGGKGYGSSYGNPSSKW